MVALRTAQTIRLRKNNPVVVDGRYDILLADHPEIFAFTRTLENDRLVVILNFSGSSSVFSLPGNLPASDPELLIANYPVEAGGDIRQIELRPYEARVYQLTRTA